MVMEDERERQTKQSASRSIGLTRRALLRGALAAGGVGIADSPVFAFTQPRRQSQETRPRPSNLALELARKLNRTNFEDLPPLAVEHARIIIASTLASAAFGSHLGSSRILRDLAKDQGGKPEATIWFDGARLPVNSVARVNAILSDSSASDDSDMRNTVHCGTTLASAGLAVAERIGASGRDLLCAMVVLIGTNSWARVHGSQRVLHGCECGASCRPRLYRQPGHAGKCRRVLCDLMGAARKAPPRS